MASDPRTLTNAEIAAQRQRFEQQQGPLANYMAYNYGRGSELDFGDRQDIMNIYRGIATGTGNVVDGISGGGSGGFSGSTYTPFLLEYKDPFNSYEGFTEFSKTGGYSPADMANLRSRGMSPIRAAYDNANREVARQRSLQGGYSPNAIAVQAKMAREFGQSSADALQDVEAKIIDSRNQGRLTGLAGMTPIEKYRLDADLDIQKYNAAERARAQSATNASHSAAQSARAGVAAANRADQFRAADAMRALYGTTPGMSALFGSQALQSIGLGASTGQGYINSTGNANSLPDAWSQNMGRVNQGMDTAQKVAGLVGTGIDAYTRYRNAQEPEEKKKPIAGNTSGPNWGEIGATGGY